MLENSHDALVISTVSTGNGINVRLQGLNNLKESRQSQQ